MINEKSLLKLKKIKIKYTIGQINLKIKWKIL